MGLMRTQQHCILVLSKGDFFLYEGLKLLDLKLKTSPTSCKYLNVCYPGSLVTLCGMGD